MAETLILRIHDGLFIEQLRELVIHDLFLSFYDQLSLLHSISHFGIVCTAKLQFIFKLHVIAGAGLKLGNLPFFHFKLCLQDLYLAVLTFDLRLEKVKLEHSFGQLFL